MRRYAVEEPVGLLMSWPTRQTVSPEGIFGPWRAASLPPLLNLPKVSA